MITKRIALALSLLALPAALEAQQGQNRPGMAGRGGMMQQNVAEFVASRAAELELDREQTAAIVAIGTETREKNEARIAEMRAAMQGGGMPSQTGRQRMAERREAMLVEAEEVQQRVLALLSVAQKEKAVTLIEEWERERRQAMPRRGANRPS